MNEPPQPRQPALIQWTLVAVLAAQVGLLWLHGGLLNRQHGEMQAMRQDIQDLTEALDNSMNDQSQSPEEGTYRKAASGQERKRHRHLQAINNVKFILQDAQENPPEGQDPTMKELQKSRDSAKKAIAESHEAQQKISIEENIRKAEEKKKIEAATSSFYPLVYWALGIGALAFIVGRAWRARAGGR